MLPEEKARKAIDSKLEEAGFVIQDYNRLNIFAAKGVIVREYPTSTGPCDYLIFINQKPVGVIEAKADEHGFELIGVEAQTSRYANSVFKDLPYANIRFVYESTGVITRFTDYNDIKYCSREIFSFHTPDELDILWQMGDTLRNRLKNNFPVFDYPGFRACQTKAIRNLEDSFRANKPKALIQMATGAGKTFTAITAIYRLLKYCDAKRILFLVDTRNLGKQALDEFQAYRPADSTKTFTELYSVQWLKSDHIAESTNVVICTIQRLYSILTGQNLPEDTEDDALNENIRQPKEVKYNPNFPIGYFDFAFIDECHRSIYNLWKQVLDYFDFFQIGLTATPDKRTYGYFNQNVVSEYSREQAVIDGVNVGEDKYIIVTHIQTHGAVIAKTERLIEVRERLTRRKRWETMDEDIAYTKNELDRSIVNKSTIRSVITAFKEAVETKVYPDRKEFPKTLIFAKSDSHADDIIQIVREVFGQGNNFCRKITYKSEANPNEEINSFRNDFDFRIAVTVDLIATGTDIRPLECLLFMRDVRSKNYFEQMIGRGTRVIDLDEFRKVSPSATTNKDHFVIFDAVGVLKSMKTEYRTLDRKPTVPLKDLLRSVALGNKSEEILTTLAGRLVRLDRIMEPDKKAKVPEITGGVTLKDISEGILNAFDLDYLRERGNERGVNENDADGLAKIREEMLTKVSQTIANPDLRDFLVQTKTAQEQYIDSVNIDTIETSDWDSSYAEDAEKTVKSFREFIEANKDEIEALSIIYDQKYKNRSITYEMIKQLHDKMFNPPHNFSVTKLWNCYYQIKPDKVRKSEVQQLADIISVVRFELGQIDELTSFRSRVNLSFKEWIFKRNSTQGYIFTDEQTRWLQLIRDHIVSSVCCTKDDLELSPFDRMGGMGRYYQLFGSEWKSILGELNATLVSA